VAGKAPVAVAVAAGGLLTECAREQAVKVVVAASGPLTWCAVKEADNEGSMAVAAAAGGPLTEYAGEAGCSSGHRWSLMLCAIKQAV
jgi:hypothetical protein